MTWLENNKISKSKIFQVGFLTYDLQPFTEECLYRVSNAIKPIVLKAYPIIHHPNEKKARIFLIPSTQKLKYFNINNPESTPEGFCANINWGTAWKCASESNIVVLFGLQGGTALLTGLLATIMRRTIISVNQTLPIAWERKRRWWIRYLKSWLLKRCSLHIYQTAVSRDVLLLVYKISVDKIFYAPFEAGASQFKCLLEKPKIQREQIRDQLGMKNEVVFLFVGTLHPFKGVSDLIEAASRLPKESKFICAFVGREEPRNKYGGTIKYYNEIAWELGIKNRIRFLGELSTEKLASIYLASDVVVLPTRKDCFPKVLVEGALASKALITTTACGSAGELIINGKNGLIIEPGDIESLAEAMKQLLDFNLRDKMGNCSRVIVEKVCKKEAETKGFVRSIYEAMKMQRGQLKRD